MSTSRITLFLAPALLAALLGACSSTRGRTASRSDHVDELIRRGKYEEAVREAAELREKHPDEDSYEFLHRKATLGYLLTVGREETLADRDEEALAIFERALAIAPESDQALEWFHKTRTKLALHWKVIGEELHAEGILDGALEAYQKALGYDPQLLPARVGASQILLLENYHDGLSERYYNEGVRALHDYYLRVSRGRFQYTQKYRPGDPRAGAREDEVEDHIADERFTMARTLEAAEHYAAARNEYYIVLLMRPGDPEAQAGYDRMKVENEAQRLFDEVSMAMLRRDFDRARELLEEGRAKTVTQVQRFEDMLANLDDARVRAMYEDAVMLQRDFQYEESLALFEKLLADRGWYDDARTRVDNLKVDIAKAEELYEKARLASTDEERLQLLRELEKHRLDYKDVRDQIIALKAKLGITDSLIGERPADGM